MVALKTEDLPRWNLIIITVVTDAQAAHIAGVSVDFVKKVRKKLKK